MNIILKNARMKQKYLMKHVCIFELKMTFSQKFTIKTKTWISAIKSIKFSAHPITCRRFSFYFLTASKEPMKTLSVLSWRLLSLALTLAI